MFLVQPISFSFGQPSMFHTPFLDLFCKVLRNLPIVEVEAIIAIKEDCFWFRTKAVRLQISATVAVEQPPTNSLIVPML